MTDKTRRNLAEQCNVKQQVIDKKKVVSDFEKAKLQKLDMTYEGKLVDGNLKLVEKAKERDQLMEHLEKRRVFLHTVKEQTESN